MTQAEMPPVGQWNWWRAVLYWLGGTLTRAIYFPGRLRVAGLEHIPKAGPFILAANHTSYLDPSTVGSAILYRRRLCYMAHSGLFRVPIFGPIIAAVGAFPVKRGAADRKAIRTAVALLRAGQPVLVFPEGTRSPTDQAHLPSELGAAYLAALSQAPVIPVGVIGTGRVLPRGAVLLRYGRVEVRIGPPVPLPMLQNGKRDKETLEQAAYAIMGAIAELTGLPHPGVAGTPSEVWPEGTGPGWKPGNATDEDAPDTGRGMTRE